MDPSEAATHARGVARAMALSQQGQWQQAAQVWDDAVVANPVNGTYWDYLAEARFEAGDYQPALRAYERVRDLGVWAERESVLPGVVEYRIACCHARLGDTTAALDALQNALAARLRDIDRLAGDEHLAVLRDDPRFAEIVGIPAVDGLDRTEGWRSDLAFLGNEVKRRGPLPMTGERARVFDTAIGRLSEQIEELSDARIIVELWRLLHLLGDGHARLHLPDRYKELDYVLPVQFYWFADGVFIVATHPTQVEHLGARVRAIDGHPIADVLEHVAAVVPQDNEQRPRELAPGWLRKPALLHALELADEPDAVTLTVGEEPDSHSDVRLTAMAPTGGAIEGFPAPPGWRFLPDMLPAPVPHYLRNAGACYWFDYLAEHRLVYFQFNTVQNDPREGLADFAHRLFRFVEDNDVTRLVVDLRWNGGGNTFLVAPLLHRLIGCAKVNRPGGLFLIIGRRTFSAAQNTATLIEWHTHATVVGEPSGSRPNFTGETIPFVLPYSQVRVNVSDLYWQTSWPLDRRKWIAPNIYVPPTFEAFAQNRDPALEAILANAEHLPSR